MHKGECPMCDKTEVELTKHHVVEAVVENGKTPSIDLCSPCHIKHERYRNYLRDKCGIDINNRKKS